MESQSKAQTKVSSNWNDYIGSMFLKADDVKDEHLVFIVSSVEEIAGDDGKVIRLHLISGDDNYRFDLNKTNATFVKNSGVANPQMLEGKKLQFKKVMAFNPRLREEVESLRIKSVM